MKYFITGICGFMGTHITEYFVSQGHEVYGIDNLFHSCTKPINSLLWKRGDIRNTEDLEQGIKWCDVCIHLAAQIHVDYSILYPQETLDINVLGTLNVLELCKKYSKKVLIASTSEIYGSAQTIKGMSELHPLDCQSPYGASKVCADRLAKSYIDTYGMNIIIVRNFNAFGPYQNDGSYGSVIARFTKAALNNEPLYIYGTGNQERDYMYVDDIVRAYDLASTVLNPGVYNFGVGETQTVKGIADKVLEITKSKSKIIYTEPRPGEVQRLCSDITKVRWMGWEPKTDFNRDLRKYVEWYKCQ